MGYPRSLALLLTALTLLAGCAVAPKSKVVFPAEATVATAASVTGTAIYRPPGDGPFPAVVLLHTCAGIGGHLGDWTGRLLAEGYAVVTVDSFSPRGIRNNCTSPPPVSLDEVTADAFAAMRHLGSVPHIASGKVAVVG